jgi:Protein of unknown function (DUF742)
VPPDSGIPVPERPSGSGASWVRGDGGPVVRPYAVTGGRTEPANDEVLDLVAVVMAIRGGDTDEDDPERTPEHRKILALCGRQATVADIAAGLSLPVGVVRVLLGDLITSGAVRVVRQRPAGQHPDTNVLQEILNGLRAL